MTPHCDNILDALENDELTPELREHLATCPNCAELYRGLSTLNEATQHSPREIPSPELIARTLSVCIKQESSSPASEAPPTHSLPARTMAAAALITLLIVVIQFRSAPDSELLRSGVALFLSRPIALAQGVLLLLAAAALALPLRRRFLISALLFGIALFPNLFVLMRF